MASTPAIQTGGLDVEPLCVTTTPSSLAAAERLALRRCRACRTWRTCLTEPPDPLKLPINFSWDKVVSVTQIVISARRSIWLATSVYTVGVNVWAQGDSPFNPPVISFFFFFCTLHSGAPHRGCPRRTRSNLETVGYINPTVCGVWGLEC